MYRKLAALTLGALLAAGLSAPAATAVLPRTKSQAKAQCNEAAARADAKCVKKPVKLGSKCRKPQIRSYAIVKYDGIWRLGVCKKGDLGRLWYLVP